MPGLFIYDYTRKKRPLESLINEPNALPPSLKQSDGISVSSFDKGVSLADVSAAA